MIDLRICEYYILVTSSRPDQVSNFARNLVQFPFKFFIIDSVCGLEHLVSGFVPATQSNLGYSCHHMCLPVAKLGNIYISHQDLSFRGAHNQEY
jgi:hypothetical protein